MPQQSLILVHGNSSKPEKEALRKLMLEAISSRLQREHKQAKIRFDQLNIEFIYHADLGIQHSGNTAYDQSQDLQDLTLCLGALNQIEKKKNFTLAAYDRLPGKSAIKEFAASVSAPLLHMSGLSKTVIGKLDKTLAAYWARESELKTNIMRRIHEGLSTATQRGDNILLLSHGAGTIYAYDALWQLSRQEAFSDNETKIDTWLTLGSPLGNPSIQKNIEGARLKGHERYPDNIRAWHNFSAEDDYVCHDNTLKDDFYYMLKNEMLRKIKDYRIYNLAVRHGQSNPHSYAGYLNHPSVVKVIAKWLKRTNK